MPNIEDAIQITVSLESASQTVKDWGIPVIVGEKQVTATKSGETTTYAYAASTTINGTSYTLAAENTPVLCYSVAEVRKQFGTETDSTDGTTIGSTATKAAAALFAQGVRRCYVVAVEAATASDITNPLASDFEACLTAIAPLAIDGKISGAMLAAQTAVDRLDKLKTFCNTYNLVFTFTNTPTASTYSSSSSLISTYITASTNLKSKNGFMLAGADPEAEDDLAAVAMGVLMKNEPWNTLMWREVSCDTAKYFLAGTLTELEDSGINAVQLTSGSNRCSNGLSTFGGTYKFIDIARTEYYVKSEVQSSLISLRANSAKVPFNQAGINMVRGAILSAMETCLSSGAIAEYTISMPRFEDTTQADRENRTLKNVVITARLAGDIHSFVVGLTINM